MEAAQKLVHVGEAGRDAGRLAAPLERRLGLQDGVREAALEGLEAAFRAARLGEVEEPFLGDLDLRRGVELEVVLVGVVDDGLADVDELAADEEVVDRAAVVLGVDDRDDVGGEPSEIGAAAERAERLVLVEERLEADRVRDLAALDER